MTLIERNASHTWKYTDRFPSIPRAGKLIPVGDRAKTCLQEVTPRSSTPPVVRKFLNSSRPAAGTIRVFHGRARDPDLASSLVHGVSTKSSLYGGTVINPPPKTSYQQRAHQLCEAVYSTNQKAPLGRSHDQRPGLPNWPDTVTPTFGVKLVKGTAAGEVVNPLKSSQQVEMEAQEGHKSYIRSHNAYFVGGTAAGEVVNPLKSSQQVEMEAQEGHKSYIRSHNAYFVGESVDRNYSWSRCAKDGRFGVATPHHNDGRSVSRSLTWLCDTQTNNSATFVSKRCDDFRERTQPQIGKVHDPIADTRKVPPNHTFGILMRPDAFDAGDLLSSSGSEEVGGGGPLGGARQRALVSAVRQHLKKVNFHNFSSLLQAFSHYDKKGQGVIDRADLQDVCGQFSLDLSAPVLDAVMQHCDVDQDGLINFLEFANFLNWKDKMPINQLDQRILTGQLQRTSTAPASMQRTAPSPPDKPASSGGLLRAEDLEPAEVGSSLKTPKTLSRSRTVQDRFVTSSSLIRAVVGGLPTAGYLTSGIPTVRTDLPAPRIKRISDHTNYGDEATAFDLLYPTMHSCRGVYEEHFFCPRTKEEMAGIFRSVGVRISEEVFEEAWRLASMRHPTGEVCVEMFRNTLKDIQTN